jgi:lipopolysaccharide export system permease protein
MRIYTRYLFLKLVAIFLVINTVLIGLISLIQLLKFIYLISKGAMLFEIIDIVILSLPSLLFIILPISTFMSVLYCYYLLLKNSELMILRSLGLNNLQIALPGISFAILITCLSYYITLSLAPNFFTQLKNKVFELKNNYTLEAVQENSFNQLSKNVNIYLGDKIAQNSFNNILIFDNTENAKLFVAKTGELDFKNGILELRLYNGIAQDFDQKTNSNNLKFSEFLIKVDMQKNMTTRDSKDASEYGLIELLKSDQHKFIAEGHQRIIWPSYNLLFVCVALSILLKTSKVELINKTELWLSILILALIYFALHFLAVKHSFFVYLQYFWFFMVLSFSMTKMV